MSVKLLNEGLEIVDQESILLYRYLTVVPKYKVWNFYEFPQNIEVFVQGLEDYSIIAEYRYRGSYVNDKYERMCDYVFCGFKVVFQ